MWGTGHKMNGLIIFCQLHFICLGGSELWKYAFPSCFQWFFSFRCEQSFSGSRWKVITWVRWSWFEPYVRLSLYEVWNTVHNKKSPCWIQQNLDLMESNKESFKSAAVMPVLVVYISSFWSFAKVTFKASGYLPLETVQLRCSSSWFSMILG